MLRRSAIVLILLPWALGLFPPAASAATITVTTTADEWMADSTSACGLREAIQAANTDAPFGGCRRGNGADTIQLGAGPYVLDEENMISGVSGQREPDDTNENGDLDVTGDVTILGPASGRATVDASDLDRAFHIKGPGADVTMRRLEIEDGKTILSDPPSSSHQDGGGIRVEQATLRFEDGSITSSEAFLHGGALAGTGITLRRSVITGNKAVTGGGLATTAPGDVITVTDSIIDSNDATNRGGGAALPFGGSLSFTRTVIRENEAPQHGGGIYSLPFFGPASVTVADSLIQDNEADNDLNNDGNGGGLHILEGSHPSDLSITGTTIRDNRAENGDGLWLLSDQTLSIANSTISSHGTVANAGQGGGIFNAAGTTTRLRNVTFANNAVSTSGNGAHVYNLGTVNVRNSVFGPDSNGGGCNAALSESGPNLEEAGGAAPCVAGQTGDLGLAALADNGGPQLLDSIGAPMTHALTAGSPAIGEGTGCEDTDQRGVPRPQGNGCDLGAYEVAMCFGRPADDPVGVTGGNTARIGTGGADVLFGLPPGETFRSLGGNDRICGLGGRDRLVAGAGADRMDGGPQTDACLGGPGRDTARACERVRGVP
jgi:CSLREA domain-containing protein